MSYEKLQDLKADLLRISQELCEFVGTFDSESLDHDLLVKEELRQRLLVEESNDLLLSCALQFLMTADDGVITHSWMSVEEELCRVLVERGILEEIKYGHFRVVTK